MGFHMVIGNNTTMDMVPGNNRTMDPDKILGGRPDNEYQHGLRWQYRPLTSICFPVAALLLHINMTLGSNNTDPEHLHSLWW